MNAFVALGIACAIIGIPAGLAALALLAAEDGRGRIESPDREGE